MKIDLDLTKDEWQFIACCIVLGMGIMGEASKKEMELAVLAIKVTGRSIGDPAPFNEKINILFDSTVE